MIDLRKLTIKTAHEHLMAGDFSAVELANEYKKNIKAKNPGINAYLEMFGDIDEQAAAADNKIAAVRKSSVGSAEKNNTEIGILTGIPISIKDNILIKGRIASSASKMLQNYRATYDATVITKLKGSGTVFLGRTNMDEFAMGGSTENSAFGVVKNPHDLSRVAGGSSGGAAASVAADLALAAIGSDTGGSIRQPASFCGLVGLKPTYGAVSRSGLMAMASSLDQIGPLAKTVDDAEILFNVIKGKDKMDSTSMDVAAIKPAIPKKLKIGVPRSYLGQGVDADVLKNFEATMTALKKEGHEIVDIEIPNLKYSLAVYYILQPAEVSSNMARFDGVKYGLLKEGNNLLDDYLLTRQAGFGKEVRRRIMLGTYVLSSGYYDAYYYKANLVRAGIIKDFEHALKNVDVVATPTSPIPAFKIGEKSNDPLAMYLADIFTVSANIITFPALSVPSGTVDRDDKKLPLGVQFTAGYGCEPTLFAAGRALEKIRP